MSTSDEIADDLRRRVRAGEFAVGTSLPDIPALELSYDADQPSVRRALHALEREGLIELTLVAVVAGDGRD